MKKRVMGHYSFSYWMIVTLLVLFAIMCIVPFWYVMVSSISDPQLVKEGQFRILPTGFSLQAYEMLFRDRRFFSGIGITLFRTLVGTTLAVFTQTTMAFALSKHYMIGQKNLTRIVIFTLLFNGGIIPSYLVVQQLRLLDTVWALILPMAFSPWNVMLLTSFFSALPSSLEESAKIDGANDLHVYAKIAIPLSLPAVATILLFVAVRHWNELMDGIIYIHSSYIKPLQVYLVELVMRTQMSSMIEPNEQNITSVSMQTAVIFASCLPIIILYPYLQKYFITGIMVGAIKG